MQKLIDDAASSNSNVGSGQLTTYSFNPITDSRIIPDTVLSDSLITNIINVKSCPGEFIAATFVVKPTTTLSSFLATPSNLQSGANTISASNVDIKGVKCWYQRGDDLYAPAADTREFLPELLLNDDSLVKVTYTDATHGSNYLKTADGVYHSINVLGEGPSATALIDDAATLQPLTINANTNKQYWITVHIPTGTPSGMYTGTITLSNGGITLEILQLSLEVLPFTLPESPIEISLYYLSRGITTTPRTDAWSARTVEQYHAEFKDLKDHGITNPQIREPIGSSSFDQYMQIRQSEGMSIKNVYFSYGNQLYSMTPAQVTTMVNNVKTWFQSHSYGIPNNYYFYTIDESSSTPYASQIEACHNAGGKTYSATDTQSQSENPLTFTSPLLDLDIICYHPKKYSYIPAVINEYHAKNLRVGIYGAPQVGEEKPLTYRINYGLLLWQYKYDVSMDYEYAGGGGCLWNDWNTEANNYKQHVFAYPTSDGVVDTIQFEGFREGVNDIRYLAKLEQTIITAKAQGKNTISAENYLSNLNSLDLSTFDLSVVRSEVISYILSLQT